MEQIPEDMSEFFFFFEGDIKTELITKKIKSNELPKGKFFFVNLIAAVTLKNNLGQIV